MKSNNSTTLISLLGTEPSFRESRDRVNQASPLFLKDLAKSLPCVVSLIPLVADFKEELLLISKNFPLKNKFDATINVITQEMNIISEPIQQNNLETRVNMRFKNDLKGSF